jgi:hypothetical protein
MYTHVSKCKNYKIKIFKYNYKKKWMLEKKWDFEYSNIPLTVLGPLFYYANMVSL